MTISFFSRGHVIQARISDRDKCFRISTGIKVMPHMKFRGNKFHGSTVEVASLNADLDRHRVRLAELYLKYGDLKGIKMEYNYTPEPDANDYSLDGLLKMYVHKMNQEEILTKSGKKFSAESIRTYAYISNLYSEFALIEGIKLPDFHVDPSWPIERKQRIGERYNKYFKKLDEWLIDKNNGLKTRHNMFNIMGIMIQYWSQVLFLNLPKLMRMPNVSKPIVRFLRDDDKIYDKLEPEKKMVWEISATILITTMRVSDAISLKPSDFNIVKDSMFLNKRNSKTNAMSQSPLPRFLSDKYRENLARYGRIYTTIPSKNKIYDHMKDMFRMYEDLHEWFTVSKLGIRGEEVTETKPLYEWAHPHLLRKTAITTMIANKVPDRHIKFLSGHAENSSSFGKYIGHVESHYKSDMLDYFNKNFN
jgi:integrase